MWHYFRCIDHVWTCVNCGMTTRPHIRVETKCHPNGSTTVIISA